ncbi:serine protease [Aliidiomarina minuta]|uniref:Serine protease n=1 Tax=Aliidiomarina minuta TaxID=880057 RepID=A0A432W9R6_9GAMM|nr:nodulation protein NfeD [Aliidiomarina minuta]RUO26849.1 serine protease [Aliidiomarina minuta]
MIKWFRCSYLLLIISGLALLTFSQLQASQPHAARMQVEGPITPATTDYLRRSMQNAAEQNAQVHIIQIDTPGGLVSSTRDIISLILESEVPVITWVAPDGARAASAGTYIAFASHVVAMAPATHLGAATPVQMSADVSEQHTQEEQERDQERELERRDGSAMERKVLNDAIAYIRNLAERHGRNADWAEEAVRDAATLTAREAEEMNVADFLASSVESLLHQADGREVVMSEGTQVLATEGLSVRDYDADWRNQILSVITNPQFAYLLLLVGVYGIIFELMSPGALFPGITGVICLLLAAFSLQILPINVVGLLLIIVGAILIVVEAFVPSFGVIGVGGVIALVAGSLMLYDGTVPGVELPMNIIISVAILGLLSVAFIVLVMARDAWRNRKPSDRDVKGLSGQVVENLNPQGQVRIDGQIWSATAVGDKRLITHGKPIRVVDQQGSMLFVEWIDKTEQRPGTAR